MPAKPIPFIGPPGQRDTGTKDQRFVNVLPEIERNANPSQYPINLVKRPGLSTSTQPTGGAATGRGIFAWSVTGHVYSVFGANIYVSTLLLTSTMATSTGRVWFQPIHEDTGTAKLMISDGVDDYQVLSTATVSTIDENTDAQFPTPNLGPLSEIDGFLLHIQANGRIWNPSVNTISTYGAADFITADTYGSNAEAMLRQKDQIIAFTKNRIEFFFNNGNPTNSPLLRIDQNTLGFGIASKATLAWAGENACFVSENAANGDGGRSVYLIQSLGKVSEISNVPLNRILFAEGLSISSGSAWMERVGGQMVYVLNLASAARTFVYSIDNAMWTEWTDTTSTKFNVSAATSLDGVVYAQDATNGRIYTFQESVYRDASSTFPAILQTARSNFGSGKKKYETSLDIVGDTSTGTMAVEVSDTDFASWTSVPSIDMGAARKRATRLGSFYNRAHRFTYNANGPLRVQAWMPKINEGMG